MKELEFIYNEYPESKGRIDDKANLTWNEITTLLSKYTRTGENDVLPVVSGSLCGFARAEKLTPGCTVYMSSNSGCIGYGNIQCVNGVCEPLGEISLYGHNQNYKIDDIKKIVSYPIAEQ